MKSHPTTLRRQWSAVVVVMVQWGEDVMVGIKDSPATYDWCSCKWKAFSRCWLTGKVVDQYK